MAVALIGAIAVLLLGSDARALEPAPDATAQLTMLLVRTPEDAELIARLRAELSGGRWRFVELEQPQRAAELGELARSVGADAAARVDRAQLAIELWFAPRPPHDRALQEVLHERDGSLLLLRAAEAVRARGLPVGAQAAVPPTAPIAAAPRLVATPVDDEQAPAEARSGAPALLRVELAPALVLSPGGLGPALGAALAAQLRVTPRLSLGAQAVVPLWVQALREPEGGAHVAPFLLGLGLDFELPLGGASLSAGAGPALVLMRMQGDAEPPLRAASDTASAAAVIARAGLHVPLGRQLRAVARVLAGSTLERIRTRFVEREVAHWGQPFTALSLGLELSVL
jgi:hypothetical protein